MNNSVKSQKECLQQEVCVKLWIVLELYQHVRIYEKKYTGEIFYNTKVTDVKIKGTLNDLALFWLFDFFSNYSTISVLFPSAPTCTCFPAFHNTFNIFQAVRCRLPSDFSLNSSSPAEVSKKIFP